ncbi:hypothetical protein FISHEDRAFT_43787 [Fistulina hepatica ATCC 64428]|uniref:DUF6699 domain-containing protein n=1 Tax=Fistulina hepatica ATCC 64428 TaxID=1128425 RepID=A0A0D7ABK2_9AGAR|nr:hypothetical protein FISHEDRAFT_43787 [Fistulina hepatica ATCC 64428]
MSGADQVGRWNPGTSYGPVLTQTELYLLRPELEVNPLLKGTSKNFHFVFNIATGQKGGFNTTSGPDRERDVPFTQGAEPATLPRVQQLYLINELSPWCTTVRNETGVTIEDVCNALFREYGDNFITEAELNSVGARLKHVIQRQAMSRMNVGGWGSGGFSPAVPVNQIRRVDWLRDHLFLDGVKHNSTYIKGRLGFDAPNIFIMEFTS